MAKNKGSWIIEIPTQGIRTGTLSTNDVMEFLDKEITFYRQLSIDGAQLNFAGQNLGSAGLSDNAITQLERIKTDVSAGKIESFENYIDDANNYNILVGQSPMGKKVSTIKAQNDHLGAVWLACVYSTTWSRISNQAANQAIGMFRTVVFGNPTVFGFDNIVAAIEAKSQSVAALKRSDEAASKLDEYIESKTSLFNRLEDLYRKQLTLQEPAVSWENIAKRKTKVWIGWLIFFALLVITPVIAAIVEWDVVSAAIAKITAASNGGFSISGLAIISVPALFYAWLLKNVSRVFIQNLNLADDASHRRSLALTYMGLLQDEKHPATDQDRAIILNALFRPIPPQTNDEGPPAGLIDLIKK